MSALPQVLVAGNPNAGKTTLFNQLAGTRARTGNYPGVTVDRRSATITLGERTVELVDVPGTYSLTASSPEESIAVDAILGEKDGDEKAVCVVTDATALGRGLYLALQVLECGFPTVLALNMMDELPERGLRIDVEGLAAALGCPVVPIVARDREGLDELRAALEAVLDRPPPPLPELDWGPAVEHAVARVSEAYASVSDPRRREAWARWALMSDREGAELELPAEVRDACRAARATTDEDLDVALVAARYAKVDELVDAHVSGEGRTRARGETLDRWLTHPVVGMLAFAAVMLIVFEALFSWSDPMIGWVEEGVVFSQDLLRATMPEGIFTDLLVEGVIAGVGNVLVFVPQIALLFLLLGFLEDCGYLARVAFVIDRLMKGVGLHGKAFVPLLGGFACAVPAVMATRTLSDRKDRLVTMLALPLMSCSARLPVYVLIVATVFAHQGDLFGFLSVGAVALFSMYALSMGATLGAAAVLRRTVLKGPRPTLVLELPPYRMPLARNLLASTWARVRTFLIDAGTVILALTIVLWALLTFPNDPAVTERYAEQRATVTATLDGAEEEEALAAIDGAEASAQLERSAAGRLGKAIEPALEPLGMDWRLGIGVIGAFAAREVFVSTLGIVFGVGDDVDEENQPLREELRAAEWPDGRTLMTPLAGVALMVFFVLACQCMSTIAVVRRESGSWKWPLLMFSYMTALAYGAALLVFQVGSALGWGT